MASGGSVPYASPPYQQSWPPLAARKRKLAAKLEAQAAQARAEADELDRRWREFAAKRWPKTPAKAEAEAS